MRQNHVKDLSFGLRSKGVLPRGEDTQNAPTEETNGDDGADIFRFGE